MSRDSRTRIPSALALIALIAGVGCSSLPTGPRPEAGSPPRADGPPGAMPSLSYNPVSDSKTIDGALGGRVSAGNFTVVIPPAAISGTATVTITQPDLSKPYVNLEISPASANGFEVPVTLVVDARPMSPKRLRTACVSWLNPSTGKWQPMPSTVNVESRTVTCRLQHFSTYAVESGGKAGW